jgi:ribose transport system substrate-binding protein
VLQALFAKHPAALLIAPTNDTALINPIKQFTDAGIPVIAVDTTIADTSVLRSRITSDNVQGGAAAADAIAKFTRDQGEVAVINVKPGISTTDARQKGFIAEIRKYPKIGTNVFSAEGVGKAVVASGKKGKVDVVGYDAEPDEVKLLKDGVITTLIIQQPAEEEVWRCNMPMIS